MAVVVLGNRPESTELDPESQGRVDTAIEVFERTDAEYLVVSGGRTNPEVPLTEADLMARYAVENGVDSIDVLREDLARDTIGNAYFARLLIEGTGADVSTVHVVSSCHHVERSAFTFEHCFGDDYHVHTDDCHRAADPAPESDEREKLEYAQDFFEPVTAGDLSQIRERLVEFHPLYDESYLSANISGIQ